MDANELTRLLKLSGMSRRALGRALDTADTTIGRWADGKHPIGFVEALGLKLYFREAHGLESRWIPTLKAVA